MKGVNILYTNEVRECPLWCFIFNVVLTAIMITLIIWNFSTFGVFGIIVVFLMTALLICCCVITGKAYFKTSNEYYVLLDKKSLTGDFIDKYDIVDKLGDIYILKEVADE